MRTRREHAVHLYADDADLTGVVVDHLLAGFRAGAPVVVVATPEHVELFEAGLRAGGVDLDSASYQALDAQSLLDRFLLDGRPDPARFDATVGAVVRDAAAAGNRSACVYGEMVAMLWAEGLVPAAIELEDLWNALAATADFSLLCAYPQTIVDDEATADVARVCDCHDVVSGFPAAPLQVSVVEHADSTIVTLAGALTGADAERLAAAVDGATLAPSVVFDLVNLSELDDGGVRALAAVADRLGRRYLMAWGARPSVRDAWDAAGLDARIHPLD